VEERRSADEAVKVASLLYHDVVLDGRYDTTGFQGTGPDRYKLDSVEFEEHLRVFAEQIGYPPATVQDLGGESRLPWLLTFDDGGLSALRIAETLAARGWRGHFFVTADFIGAKRFLSAADIRSLDGMGHVIGSHSCSHPARMAQCSWAQLNDEWSRSKGVLEDIVGHPVAVASIPGGEYSKTVARAAAGVGIQQLFTSEPVLSVRGIDGCDVFGRFAIVRNVPPQRAAALAAAQTAPRLRQFAFWQAKKAVKAVGGDRYLKLRRFLLERLR
jgi:peptidoglycan/xylan/chitin deacetylase (PgdA/CDA1 family)